MPTRRGRLLGRGGHGRRVRDGRPRCGRPRPERSSRVRACRLGGEHRRRAAARRRRVRRRHLDDRRVRHAGGNRRRVGSRLVVRGSLPARHGGVRGRAEFRLELRLERTQRIPLLLHGAGPTPRPAATVVNSHRKRPVVGPTSVVACRRWLAKRVSGFLALCSAKNKIEPRTGRGPRSACAAPRLAQGRASSRLRHAFRAPRVTKAHSNSRRRTANLSDPTPNRAAAPCQSARRRRSSRVTPTRSTTASMTITAGYVPARENDDPPPRSARGGVHLAAPETNDVAIRRASILDVPPRPNSVSDAILFHPPPLPFPSRSAWRRVLPIAPSRSSTCPASSRRSSRT